MTRSREFSDGKIAHGLLAELADAMDSKSISAKTQDSNPQAFTPTRPETLSLGLPLNLQNDPDLKAVVEAWPELPQALRIGIMAMVEASTKT
ncbi:MAG: hypothetical protein ABR964_09850 [Tepidisphaeraceae bacterium]|jgi:hypothetical protein